MSLISESSTIAEKTAVRHVYKGECHDKMQFITKLLINKGAVFRKSSIHKHILFFICSHCQLIWTVIFIIIRYSQKHPSKSIDDLKDKPAITLMSNM